MIVKVNGLKKSFGKTKAVDDVSFIFGSGDIFGFVGPNGAGKTTTMRIISTLDHPDCGDVCFDGVSAVEYPERIRLKMGFVPDTLPVVADTTVHEYLDFFARAYGINGRDRIRTIGEVEDFTKLTDLRDKLLKSLSKGMKQRVCLGRALIHNPDVLILDEPAAGLDPRARVELRELLQVLSEQGKAILISSHILTELTEICNGAIIMEQGKVLEKGSISDIIARGTPRCAITVRVLDRKAELQTLLMTIPGVDNIAVADNDIVISLEGGEPECAELLTFIVGAGFKVSEFQRKRTDLEDIFMKITKGAVQ
ncbi:MAG: ABC transporter ATP-binding protein [bacterium]